MADFEDRLRNKDSSAITDIQKQVKAGELAAHDVKSIYAAAGYRSAM